jgi:hypothetical protein
LLEAESGRLLSRKRRPIKASTLAVEAVPRVGKEQMAGTANDDTIDSGDTTGDGKADFQITFNGLKALLTDEFIL